MNGFKIEVFENVKTGFYVWRITRYNEDGNEVAFSPPWDRGWDTRKMESGDNKKFRSVTDAAEDAAKMFGRIAAAEIQDQLAQAFRDTRPVATVVT